MKKLLSIILILSVLLPAGVYAEADNASYYAPDLLGVILFSMTEEDLLSMKRHNEEYAVFAVQWYMNEYDLAETVFYSDEKSDAEEHGWDIAEYGVVFSTRTGQISRMFLNRLEGRIGKGYMEDFAYEIISEWLTQSYGKSQYSDLAGTSAVYAPANVKTESWKEQAWRGERTYTVIHYEQWVLPVKDGGFMLIHHSEYMEQSDKGDPVIHHIVEFYPYDWRLNIIEEHMQVRESPQYGG